MGTIEVWARPVRSTLAGGAWHAYFKYIDETGRQYFLSGRNADVPYGGSFAVESGVYKRDAFEWPKKEEQGQRHRKLGTVYKGSDAGVWFEDLAHQLTAFADKYRYYFDHLNSNSFVNSALKNLDLRTVKEPARVGPTLQGYDVWLPGLTNDGLKTLPDNNRPVSPFTNPNREPLSAERESGNRYSRLYGADDVSAAGRYGIRNNSATSRSVVGDHVRRVANPAPEPGPNKYITDAARDYGLGAVGDGRRTGAPDGFSDFAILFAPPLSDAARQAVIDDYVKGSDDDWL